MLGYGLLRITRHQQDFEIPVKRKPRFHQLIPVHSRHPDVADQQIDARILFEDFEGGVAVRCFDDSAARIFQQASLKASAMVTLADNMRAWPLRSSTDLLRNSGPAASPQINSAGMSPGMP